MRELKRIGSYLKKYKLECILAPLFKLLEASFELLVPLVMAAIIDSGTPNNDKEVIFKSGGILVAFALIGFICAVTAQFFSAKLASGFGTALRDDLFEKIMSFSHAEFDILGRDTLITRMSSDTMQIQTSVNIFFRLVLRSPFIVLGAMYMAYVVDKRTGIIFLIVITMLALIVYTLLKQSVKLFRMVQKKLDEILGRSLENLTGVRVIRAFSKQKSEEDKFNNNINELYNVQMKAGNITMLINPLTYAVVNIGVIAILQVGSKDVFNGFITKGQVVALVNYMLQILVELLKIARMVDIMSKSFACARRVEEVFDVESSLADGKLDAIQALNDFKNETPFISFKDVAFKYPLASGMALENINLEVKKGETIGIIGGTGSGKTTLVDLLMRFYDITSGSLKIMDNEIKDYNIESLRKVVAIAEQKSRLFMGTIQSNLEWGKSNPTSEEVLEAITLAQAKDVLDKKSTEGGLLSEVSQAGTNFSGGQKQRLSLARTLITKAQILILDDVSSALDYITDAKLRKALRENLSFATVFMVSQRISSIRSADKIIVMDAGKIVGQGSHKELIKTCEVYREICLSQLSKEEVLDA